MFRVGEVVEYIGGYSSWAVTPNAKYKIKDVDPQQGTLLITNDQNQDDWYGDQYFKFVPCGGISIGDVIRPTSNIVYGVSNQYVYIVIDVDKHNGEVLIQNDNGLDQWYPHTLFEHVSPAKKTGSQAHVSLGGTQLKGYDNGNGGQSLYLDPPEIPVKQCCCEMRELMMYGCQCGAIESERRRRTS